MLTHSEVLGDQSELRAQLQRDGGAHRDLLRLSWARPLGDIAFDWAAILTATAAVVWVGLETLPPALLVIANRQRALAGLVMGSGLAASGAAYLAGWVGWIDGDTDTVSLVGGLGVSAVVGLICAGGGPRSISVGGLRR